MAKKIILYGASDCPHCTDVKAALEKEEIKYGYVDVRESLGHLKKFLNLRDANPEVFKDVRENGRVGIPALVVDDTEVIVKTAADIDFKTLK